MSLFGTIYNGTTGLVAFSRGLDVISNNVANLNTPGFKRNDLLFRDLLYHFQLTGETNQDYSARKDGGGVTDAGTVTSFAQGDIQQSGNEIDVAINGNGFLILRGDEGLLYTRAGQFEFDEDGFLVAAGSDARVMGIDANGKLVDINIKGLRTTPSLPTSRVTFTDNLSSGSTEHVIAEIEVFDADGQRRQLTLTLTNNSTQTPRSWLAEIVDEEDNVVATDLEIRFQGNGSPEEGFNSFVFELTSEDDAVSNIEFFFGEPGSFTAATSFSAGASSDLAVDDQDGMPFGGLVTLNFNRDGVLELEYSNGESVEGGRLALAWLNDLQVLQQIGNGLFEIDDPRRLLVAAANTEGLGEVVGGSVEISNVELSQEFSDLVIVQRGFQVSSQVVSIANEMIQQLIDSSSSR